MSPALQTCVRDFNLSKRMSDLARYNEAIVRPDGESIVFFDVSQSIDRYPWGINICPCICPMGRLILRKTVSGRAEVVRPLFPIEGLRMQGMFECMLPCPENLGSFTGKDIWGLAGNAFAAPHVHLAFVICMSVFSLPQTKAEVVHLRAAHSEG